MEIDNATEKAFKTKACPICTEKMWFWRKICEKCFINKFRIFLNTI